MGGGPSGTTHSSAVMRRSKARDTLYYAAASPARAKAPRSNSNDMGFPLGNRTRVIRRVLGATPEQRVGGQSPLRPVRNRARGRRTLKRKADLSVNGSAAPEAREARTRPCRDPAPMRENPLDDLGIVQLGRSALGGLHNAHTASTSMPKARCISAAQVQVRGGGFTLASPGPVARSAVEAVGSGASLP